MTPKLGCVGLGNIGEPLVRHLLLAGYEVLVHDKRAEAVSRLDDTLAEPVENLKGLASAADAVLLSLPNSTVVDAGHCKEAHGEGRRHARRPGERWRAAGHGGNFVGDGRGQAGSLRAVLRDPRGVWRQDLLRGRPWGRAPGQVTQQPALGDHPRQRRRGTGPGPKGRYLP